MLRMGHSFSHKPQPIHFWESIFSLSVYFFVFPQKYSLCPNRPAKWDTIPNPSWGAFPFFSLLTDLYIFSSALATIFLFSSKLRFNTFSSQILSGIFKCNPPTITAPCFINKRANIPAPSPLKSAIVAIIKMVLSFHIYEWSTIKSCSIFGILLNCAG